MPDVRDLVSVGLLGGVLALDRTAFLQTMASRPLVGSSLVGYLLGEPALGLTCGLLLELFWLMDLPVGAAIPPDETLVGVLASVFAVSAPSQWSPEARAALGVLIAIPFGFLGRGLDVTVRKWNGRLVDQARERVAAGGPVGLGRAHLIGVSRFFLAGFLATVVGSLAGWWLVRAVVAALPPRAVDALELAEAALPVLGIAFVLAALRGRRSKLLFSGGLLGGLALGHARDLVPLFSGRPWRH